MARRFGEAFALPICIKRAHDKRCSNENWAGAQMKQTMKNTMNKNVALALSAMVALSACGNPNSDSSPMAAVKSGVQSTTQASSSSADTQSNAPTSVNLAKPATQAEAFAAINNSQTQGIKDILAAVGGSGEEMSPSVTKPTVIAGYYQQTIVEKTEQDIKFALSSARQKNLGAVASHAGSLGSLPAGQKTALINDVNNSLDLLQNLNPTFLSAVDQMMLQTNIAVLLKLREALMGAQ